MRDQQEQLPFPHDRENIADLTARLAARADIEHLNRRDDTHDELAARKHAEITRLAEWAAQHDRSRERPTETIQPNGDLL